MNKSQKTREILGKALNAVAVTLYALADVATLAGEKQLAAEINRLAKLAGEASWMAEQ